MFRNFCEGQTTGPLYVLLALLAMKPDTGILGSVIPTAGLLGPNGETERRVLARELHVQYVVTCHEPGQGHLSQSSTTESLVIGARKRAGEERPTTFVSLDRFPRDTTEAYEIIEAIAARNETLGVSIRDISAERIKAGDWSAAGWCNLALDDAAGWMDRCPALRRMGDIEGVTLSAPGHGKTTECEPGKEDLWVYAKRGKGGQTKLAGKPDTPVKIKQNQSGDTAKSDEGAAETVRQWKRKYAARLLVTTKQRLGTARVTSVVDENAEALAADAWKPVNGIDKETAKAWSVFLNSTLGRIEFMRQRGDKLDYPMWRPKGLKKIRVPDPTDRALIETLADCYDKTRSTVVDRYDAGQVTVRNQWDDAVSEAIGIDRKKLQEYAAMLNEEPVVSKKRFRERVRQGT